MRTICMFVHMLMHKCRLVHLDLLFGVYMLFLQCSDLLPQSKNMHIRSIGDPELLLCECVSTVLEYTYQCHMIIPTESTGVKCCGKRQEKQTNNQSKLAPIIFFP